MVLDATPGGPTANAYCPVATATLLLSEQLYTTAWALAPVQDQETALIWATRLLDEQVVWAGTPTTTTQALAWPRTGVHDCQGRLVDALTIPLDVQRATATYALALLSDPSQGSPGVPAGVVKRTQLGDTSVEYFPPSSGQTLTSTSPQTSMPQSIRQLLTCYGWIRGGINIPILRT